MMKTRYIPMALLALAGMCPGAPQKSPGELDLSELTKRETTPLRDAKTMYERASKILEDRGIKNVSGVPAMLETCASAGYVPAVYKLFDVYEGRHAGLDAQPQKAFKLAAKYAQKSADGKETPERKALRHEAMFRYASYCERGYGCQKSDKEAFRWMYRAASEKMGRARVELARYFMNGVGCTPKPKFALALLHEQEKLAPATPHLFFYLGHMYFYGIGLPRRDCKQALRYFERGRKLGDSHSTNNLAVMHERGIGCSKDTAYALKLYREAAAAGNKEASANAQRLGYKAGEKVERKTTMSERVCNTSLRIVKSLPVTRVFKEKLIRFFSTPD